MNDDDDDDSTLFSLDVSMGCLVVFMGVKMLQHIQHPTKSLNQTDAGASFQFPVSVFCIVFCSVASRHYNTYLIKAR